MYQIGQVANIIKAQLVQEPSGNSQVSILLVDSRQLQNPSLTLFFALKGSRQDGHAFIKDLYQKGVRNFVIDHAQKVDDLDMANVLRVDDVLAALQMLAAYHRSQYHFPIVGITGSNGKTIIKEWLFQLLHLDFHIVKSPRSYNSQVGVPLSVWQLNRDCDLAIFEAGISLPGEMEHLQKIIQPTRGIFSNIGSAHAEGFHSLKQKLAEKIKLFKECALVICCRDHQLIYDALLDNNIPVFCWSVKGDANLKVKVTKLKKTTRIQFWEDGVPAEVKIPFVDEASIENAIHCLAFIKAAKIEITNLELRFESLLPIGMRLEALEGINDCLIINDVYNADLESLNVALSFGSFQAHHLKKSLIITDLLQQSQDVSTYHQVADLIFRYGFNRVLAVGDRIRDLVNYLDAKIEHHFYQSTTELIDALPQHHFYKELILIKGARIFGLERVTELLSLKTHQTTLEVNLAALARNLKVFEGHLKHRNTKIMGMVKAAAYGSGSIEIARFLESRNIDYLTVAYVDEGIELRQAGIRTPIMVLNTDLHNLALIVSHSLEPEIYSIDQLRTIAGYTKYQKVEVSVHLKIETGMNRLGLVEADLETIGTILQQSPKLLVKSIFSHFAASDDPAEDDFTRLQLKQLQRCAKKLGEHMGYAPLLHIANSQAIIRFPESQLNMVRIGIGMYGIGMPDNISLECVHTLKTHVSQIKHLKPGDTVGYGRRGEVTQHRKIAVIAVGYADGLIRKAGNGRYAVIVNDQKAPIVGSICMDMTMIDITDISDVTVGSEVIIFGKEPSVATLATAADTIPYEVFTNLSSRIKRIYTYD